MEKLFLLDNLKDFLFSNSRTNIDNPVFRLHYQATKGILLLFSFLLACSQFIGDPIDCIEETVPASPNKVDTYCWSQTTFSIPDSWDKKEGLEVAYPGVDKDSPDKKRVYHAYYQYVWVFLFLQAVLFYLPRYFWKCIEGGKVKNLILGLDSPAIAKNEKRTNYALLLGYLVANLNLKQNNLYFMCYVLAELMNFCNVVSQIFLTDSFLGGEFLKYGLEVIQFTGWKWHERNDPMTKVFPLVTRCTLLFYSEGGTVDNHEALCFLKINKINEIVYIILWFWFLILSLPSGLILVHRCVLILSVQSRISITCYRIGPFNPDYVRTIVENGNIGDWFLLYLLSKNINPIDLRDIVFNFSLRIREQKVENEDKGEADFKSRGQDDTEVLEDKV